MEMENNTVFALVTDKSYFYKVIVTINDLRTAGAWSGDIVLVTIDFDLDELDQNYKQKYNIIEVKFPLIDKTLLLEKIGPNGFINSDKRELHKLNQWEKLHIFDDYFSKWNRVVYLDAGLRVLDDIKYLLELDYTDKILAPNDASPNFHPNQIFKFQLDWAKPELIDLVVNELADGDRDNMFHSHHMLNCMWVYDTNILKICNKAQLIEAMNKYTLCRTNEMGIMNLLFHFKYNLWREFPLKNSDGKYLFEWCETNHSFYTTWKDYCFLKYPNSIRMNQTPC